jgi:hypothetical protein
MPESAATNAASYTTPWDTISRFRNERLEITIGDGEPVDPKPIDTDPMRGRLFCVVIVGPHAKFASRYPGHRCVSKMWLLQAVLQRRTSHSATRFFGRQALWFAAIWLFRD